MKIARLTFYDPENLSKLRERGLDLSIIDGLLHDFLNKNMDSSDDLSKKKQIIADLESKKHEIELEYNFFSFIKRKKIDILAQRWLKAYAEGNNFEINKLKLSEDVNNYMKTRTYARQFWKFKQKDLEKGVIKWACLQKST